MPYPQLARSRPHRSGGDVMDNMLDLQSRIARLIPCFTGLSDETLN